MLKRLLKAWRAAKAEFRRAWHDAPAPILDKAIPARFRVLADYGDGLTCIYDGEMGAQARRTFDSVKAVVQTVELWDGPVRRGHWDKRSERKRTRV